MNRTLHAGVIRTGDDRKHHPNGRIRWYRQKCLLSERAARQSQTADDSAQNEVVKQWHYAFGR
jgi:hypothetical protein